MFAAAEHPMILTVLEALVQPGNEEALLAAYRDAATRSRPAGSRASRCSSLCTSPTGRERVAHPDLVVEPRGARRDAPARHARGGAHVSGGGSGADAGVVRDRRAHRGERTAAL